ncbi:proline-rich protein 36-like [Penaeus japonicus]|uniref:proline-rich protein 36-like n=1 Tax=Penaeus japonicus TaxID=27405 RepID=UPI001C71549C|nr:proline-rich protein 36-like [Penaeus japonicus]
MECGSSLATRHAVPRPVVWILDSLGTALPLLSLGLSCGFPRLRDRPPLLSLGLSACRVILDFGTALLWAVPRPVVWILDLLGTASSAIPSGPPSLCCPSARRVDSRFPRDRPPSAVPRLVVDSRFPRDRPPSAVPRPVVWILDSLNASSAVPRPVIPSGPPSLCCPSACRVDSRFPRDRPPSAVRRPVVWILDSLGTASPLLSLGFSSVVWILDSLGTALPLLSLGLSFPRDRPPSAVPRPVVWILDLSGPPSLCCPSACRVDSRFPRDRPPSAVPRFVVDSRFPRDRPPSAVPRPVIPSGPPSLCCPSACRVDSRFPRDRFSSAVPRPVVWILDSLGTAPPLLSPRPVIPSGPPSLCCPSACRVDSRFPRDRPPSAVPRPVVWILDSSPSPLASIPSGPPSLCCPSACRVDSRFPRDRPPSAVPRPVVWILDSLGTALPLLSLGLSCDFLGFPRDRPPSAVPRPVIPSGPPSLCCPSACRVDSRFPRDRLLCCPSACRVDSRFPRDRPPSAVPRPVVWILDSLGTALPLLSLGLSCGF